MIYFLIGWLIGQNERPKDGAPVPTKYDKMTPQQLKTIHERVIIARIMLVCGVVPWIIVGNLTGLLGVFGFPLIWLAICHAVEYSAE